MQKYNPLRKGTVVIIIAIFIGISIIPSTVGVDKPSMPTFDDPTIVSIQPSTQVVEQGETFNVSVWVYPGEPITSIGFLYLYFNATIIHVNHVWYDGFFDPYPTITPPPVFDNVNGYIESGWEGILGDGSVTSNGSWVTINFTAQNVDGVSLLELDGVEILDEDYVPVPTTINNGIVTVAAPPEITNVMLTTSEPLDTMPGFGWENFSCTVTDDIGVHTVKIIITYPYGTILEHPMTHILGTDVFYYNTTFTDAGYYMYSIWADDTEGNIATSSYQIFVLPMNEDVNMDGCVTEGDLIILIPLDGWEGPPGWIRADIDNNGIITFMDILLVALHVGECLPLPPWLTPPEITNVELIASLPRDTEPGFGWENFTCTVTDDGMLDVVQINFTYTKTYFHPWIWGVSTEREEYFNFPMNNTGNTYYYNTTLGDAGDYTYHIWATDSNGNQNSTLPESFFLPLNADINEDGCIGFVDIMSVTGLWTATGPNGWHRADVDNNGYVGFTDLMRVTGWFWL